MAGVKVKTTREHFAPIKREDSLPSWLECSQITERLRGVVEAEYSYLTVVPQGNPLTN